MENNDLLACCTAPSSSCTEACSRWPLFSMHAPQSCSHGEPPLAGRRNVVIIVGSVHLLACCTAPSSCTEACSHWPLFSVHAPQSCSHGEPPLAGRRNVVIIVGSVHLLACCTAPSSCTEACSHWPPFSVHAPDLGVVNMESHPLPAGMNVVITVGSVHLLYITTAGYAISSQLLPGQTVGSFHHSANHTCRTTPPPPHPAKLGKTPCRVSNPC